MRIIDSDILSYALYDESPAHPYAWEVVERGLLGNIEIFASKHSLIAENPIPRNVKES